MKDTVTQPMVILANGKSGRASNGQPLAEIAMGLQERGVEVVLRQLKQGEDFASAAREAIRSGAPAIIAAGGDGTICGIAAALVGTQTALGIIPMGTFNYFARSLDIPEDVDGALEVIARNVRHQTNVGSINDKIFLNNTSLGIYPEVLKIREDTYAYWGRSRIAAYWSVLRTMIRLPRPLKIEIVANGHRETLKTPLVFVVSNAFQLRQMGLEGEECIEAGQLALLIAQDTGRFGLLRNGVALLLGIAQRDRNFRLICSEAIDITPRRKSLLVARDGERERMAGPFKVVMRAGALTVIAPPQVQAEVR